MNTARAGENAPHSHRAPSLNTQELTLQIQKAVSQVANLSAKKCQGMRMKRQSVNVAGKRGEEGEEDTLDVLAADGVVLQMCPEDIMDCDADEIASEH